jgi:hypothetical protein
MIVKRTNSDDIDFQELVNALDAELKVRDGDEHAFYAALNTTESQHHVVVLYIGDSLVGCGALRLFADDCMEVKRMFVEKKITTKSVHLYSRWWSRT